MWRRYNARVSRPRWNREAAAWAEAHGVAKSTGSDAHTLADIGDAWIETPEMGVSTPDGLMTADPCGDGFGTVDAPTGVVRLQTLGFGFEITKRYISRKG